MKNLEEEVQQTISEMKKAFGIGVNVSVSNTKIYSIDEKKFHTNNLIEVIHDPANESPWSKEMREIKHWNKSLEIGIKIKSEIMDAKANGVENFGELEIL